MAIKPPSAIERVAGNSGTALAFAAIAAIDGGALTALLPVLGTTLASERQRNRVESAIAEINLQLIAQGEKLKQISDAQYKLINETVLTIFHTTCDEKIKYLKAVVNNSLSLNDLESQDATQLARLVRDISAAEADFLIQNFHYANVWLLLPFEESTQNAVSNDPSFKDTLFLKIQSQQGRIAVGLASLGVLAKAGDRIMDKSLLKFMPIAAKLIALLKKSAD